MTDKTKQGLELKDYLTIAVSLLAFLVSAGSAYFSIVRTEEAVSLISDKEPFAIIADEQTLVITPNRDGEVAFVNSGNRSAIISSIVVFYIQPQGTDERKCPDDTGINILTDFEPTVLKPGEIIVKKFKLTKAWPYYSGSITATRTDSGDFLLPIADHNKGKKDITVDVCLNIQLSTPSMIYHSVIIPVFQFHALEDGVNYYPQSDLIRKMPTLLVSRTGSIFGY
jgi:hypothetical protein